MKAFKVEIGGRVTGVGFRFSALYKAQSLPSLRGYVRNKGHGCVEALVCGDESEVREMLDWLSRGPPSARIDSFTATECEAPRDEDSFTIR